MCISKKLKTLTVAKQEGVGRSEYIDLVLPFAMDFADVRRPGQSEGARRAKRTLDARTMTAYGSNTILPEAGEWLEAAA